jgi:diguanylate cyclase (GGDEF)-like protein
VAFSGSIRESIFPFLLEVDTSLQVARIGPLMQRICPDIQYGANLFDHFELDGAAAEIKTHAALGEYARRSIVMKSRCAEPRVFKGEWFLDDGEQRLCFLGWPWIRDGDELSKMGITLHDIPAHNPLGDLLLLLRSSQNTLADTRELAERLRERSNDLKRAYRQLEHIAHFDPLTGLPNRVLLSDRLQQAMSQSQRQGRTLAVIYLDLDGFKPINDRHGHAIGDQLLVTLAQRMKEVLREGETLSRIGGDEFVAVLVDLEEPQDCTPVLYRLLQAAAEPIIAGDFTLSVSASIGVTFFPQDNGDADLLLRHADQAMYQAKQNGKNRYHLFDVAQDAAITTRHESIDRIRRALAANEFVLHFQPKVDMRTGRVVGVEALIRWQQPELGLLPPANFLPVIEGHALIIDIGEWVIESALAQLDQWNGMGLNLPVSVNIDASQLQRSGFVEQLTDLLARHPGIKPGQLELEILESSALDDIEHVAKLMYQCRELGVNFSLDDFGTGYSSLTYLKRLPAETLKIDRSFVLDMLDDPDDLAIVRGVIGLAEAFRRQAIAEGVETIAHGTRLLALGCSLAQGYCIARPMPADEIPGWVAHWRPDNAWTG